MRLPEYLTRLSPVGETLAAMEAGEEALAAEVAERNAQLAVSTADGGLALWEADYGLPVRAGGDTQDRRAAVLAAMNIADQYFREQDAAENLRRQIKDNLEEVNQLKMELSEAKREICKLQNRK